MGSQPQAAHRWRRPSAGLHGLHTTRPGDSVRLNSFYRRSTMQFRIGYVAILVILAGCLVWAQTTTATLSGVVRDPQGGLIPNATISVVEVETGQTRQTTSGA